MNNNKHTDESSYIRNSDSSNAYEIDSQYVSDHFQALFN